MSDFAEWMRARQSRIETVLERVLPARDLAPARLHEAMRYAVLGGGKRIRPLLAYGAGEAVEALPDAVDVVAAAVECIHVYSLVHDDLPCMDDDVMRRGKPTVHVQFDEATALLVGDSLQSLAFQSLAEPGTLLPLERRADMLHQLAMAAGSRGMAGGQAVDLESLGKSLTLPELEFMHIHKTGALIRAAVGMAALCGAAHESTRAALDRYAKYVGLAFQVVDDVLDATASTATLGKTAGKDERADKPTYVSAMGVEKARAFAEELLSEALSALKPLEGRAGRLSALAQFVVARQF